MYVKKLIFSTVVLGVVAVSFLSSYKYSNGSIALTQLLSLTSVNAENNDCNASTYGSGAYLKEHNCVITSSVWDITRLKWVVTTEDGFKKCCTKDAGSPPNSSCYGTQETVCHKA